MRARDATLVLAAALAAGAAQAEWKYRNLTAGGELRPGVYGRIDVGSAAPPPLIYPKALVASQAFTVPSGQPVYLYVPPGQVRQWQRFCAKWDACDVPVLFIRVDDSPSRFGQWKHRPQQVALGR